MTNEYMVDKIREWAKNGVISYDYEVERLKVYGVPPDAAEAMAAEDTLYYESDH
ncbi:hypothetical protein ES705_37656 [subsurface metagenome]